MSSVKEAFGGIGTFTITNANLSASKTAGWKSNAFDNTSLLFLDVLVHFRFASVVWGGNQTILVSFHALADPAGTNYTSTGDGTPDGTEGTMTFPDYTTSALVCPIRIIRTPLASKAINAGPFSVARMFGGVIPPKFCLGMINDTGVALSVTAIEYNGVYSTVV